MTWAATATTSSGARKLHVGEDAAEADDRGAGDARRARPRRAGGGRPGDRGGAGARVGRARPAPRAGRAARRRRTGAAAGGSGGGQRGRPVEARRRPAAAHGGAQPVARGVSVPSRPPAPATVGPPVAPGRTAARPRARRLGPSRRGGRARRRAAAPVSTTTTPLTPVAERPRRRRPGRCRPWRLDARPGARGWRSTWACPAAKPESVPSVVTRRTRSWRRAPAATMLAAAETASSKRLGGVVAGADVEQHGGAALPGQLVLADHELVVAGGRRPVHPAQVVADDVGAQRVEVLAAAAEGVGVLGAGERVVAGGQRDGGERRRSAGSTVSSETPAAGERAGAASPNGSASSTCERPDGDDAAALGGRGGRRPGPRRPAPSGADERRWRRGCPTPRSRRREHGACAGGRGCATREVDPARRAGVDPGRVQLAGRPSTSRRVSAPATSDRRRPAGQPSAAPSDVAARRVPKSRPSDEQRPPASTPASQPRRVSTRRSGLIRPPWARGRVAEHLGEGVGRA